MRALTTLVAVVTVVLAGCGGDEPAAPGDDGLRAIDRELLAAAYENDIAAARRLVDEGADVDIPDESGTTALAHARRLGFTAIERILVEAGARAA